MPATGEELVEEQEDDPVECSTCKSGDATVENPIIKCDGEHETEVGFHIKCLTPPLSLDDIPSGLWLCNACREKGLWQAESVRNKKTMKGKCKRACVHYLIHWSGYPSDDDTWEPISSVPAGAKSLIKDYNQQCSNSRI